MRPAAKPNPRAQMLLGLMVVIVGLLFLVDNLGWIDLDFRRMVWPAALIFVGVLKLMQTRTQSGTLIGVGLVAAGSISMLRAIGFLHFDWREIWPVVLIGVGIAIVFKASTASQAALSDAKAPLMKEGDDSVVNVTSIMGASNRRVTSPDFRGGEVTAILGSSDLDLRQSSINGDAVLNVFSVLGGITIKVPVDWVIVMEGSAILGGYEEKTAPPTGNTKRLIVRGYAILGGLEVRN